MIVPFVRVIVVDAPSERVTLLELNDGCNSSSELFEHEIEVIEKSIVMRTHMIVVFIIL
jgi:hypothetical protein